MQFQIDRTQAQLPHLQIGAPESSRAPHFVEELVRNRFARPVLSREEMQRRLLHGPVFHDLRRQFHKIPWHAGAGKGSYRHAAQCMVQEMAELMENSFYVPMSQQRGCIADRWG